MDLHLGLASALWLGILAAISPCPLATNIAAISYIARDIDSTKRILLTGAVYALGRALAYVGLGFLVVSSLLTIPDVAMILQTEANKILGPILILVGVFLLGVLKFPGFGISVTDRVQKKLANAGIWGAGVLGILFALSFCPVSAGLFFGGVIPQSLKANSSFFFTTTFGIGTALPVIAFSFVTAFGTRYTATFFGKLTQVEKWVRPLTAVIFIAVGGYLLYQVIPKPGWE